MAATLAVKALAAKAWAAARTGLALLALAAVFPLAAACAGGSQGPQPGSSPAAPQSGPVSPAPGGGPGTLTVYSGRSESLVAPIIQQFSAATGIRVSVKYAGTAQLAATLLEEGQRTPADVYFAQDPGGLGAVENMLAPLPPRILDLVPQWARSPQGKWVGLSGRARTVVYNTAKIKETDLPDDIFDLTQPQWSGRIGWVPSNASFQTMVTAMRALWGEEKTRQWLEGMERNDPKVYSGNSAAVVAVADGEVELALVNHYYIYPFLTERGPAFPARNYHPRAGGPGSLVMVAGAGVLEASQNREAAERFLEFMLSPVAQQYFASQTFEYPLVEGVKTTAGLTPLDQIKSPALPLSQLADLEGTQALLRQTGILP
jgi:iron(III) transport system substrate-binding protein